MSHLVTKCIQNAKMSHLVTGVWVTHTAHACGPVTPPVYMATCDWWL